MGRKYYWRPKVDFGTSQSTLNISGLPKYCPQTQSWCFYSLTPTPQCQQQSEEKMEPKDPTESGLQQTTSDGSVKTPSQTTGLTRLRERPLMTNKYYKFDFDSSEDVLKPINANDFDSIDEFIDALNSAAYGETQRFDDMEKERLKELREPDYYKQEESVEKHMAGEAEQWPVGAFLEEFRLDDPVNNPSHYTIGNIETINYIVDVMGEYHAAMFCHGNVLKYTGTRLFGKGKPIQDAKKAVWYLNKMIELLEFTEDTNW